MHSLLRPSPHSNAQQALLALEVYLYIGEVNLREFIWKREERKAGNLKPSGHTEINGFLRNTEQLITFEQRTSGDVIKEGPLSDYSNVCVIPKDSDNGGQGIKT